MNLVNFKFFFIGCLLFLNTSRGYAFDVGVSSSQSTAIKSQKIKFSHSFNKKNKVSLSLKTSTDIQATDDAKSSQVKLGYRYKFDNDLSFSPYFKKSDEFYNFTSQGFGIDLSYPIYSYHRYEVLVVEEKIKLPPEPNTEKLANSNQEANSADTLIEKKSSELDSEILPEPVEKFKIIKKRKKSLIETLNTTLSLGFETSQHNYSKNKEGYRTTQFFVSLSQDLPYGLSAGADYTKAIYYSDTTQLSNALNKKTVLSSDISNTVSSLSDSSIGVNAEFNYEWFTFGVSYGYDTALLSQSKSMSNSYFIDLELFEVLTLDISLTEGRTENSTSVSRSTSFGLGYKF